MLIKKYKLEKVFVEETLYRFPTEVLYLFEFHVRRSIKVTPIFTSWNKERFNKDEEIYKFKIVVLYDGFNHNANIINYFIPISKFDEIYNKGKSIEYDLLDFINTYGLENIRTKEQFQIDFDNVFKELI